MNDKQKKKWSKKYRKIWKEKDITHLKTDGMEIMERDLNFRIWFFFCSLSRIHTQILAEKKQFSSALAIRLDRNNFVVDV